MTGDQRIGAGNLKKIQCDLCGVGANADEFSEAEIETLYGFDYELNTYGREEHLFFTNDGAISRSQVFYEWISPHIPQSANSLLEVGCGEGMLLSKIAEHNPNIRCQGVDGSKKAIELARKKGLNVVQGLIHGQQDQLPRVDCLMLINVIEHIEDLTGVFTVLRNALRDQGRIIFCLPIQDYGGYDIVFAEHVWHFTTTQFMRLVQINGLEVLHQDSEHPINHGIGLFVCKKAVQPLVPLPITDERFVLQESLKKWRTVFNQVNESLSKYKYQSIAVFGSGEVFTLLLAFTHLGKIEIKFIVDETKSKQGSEKHGIQIVGLEELFVQNPSLLVVTTNPKYNDLIKKKIKGWSGTLITL